MEDTTAPGSGRAHALARVLADVGGSDVVGRLAGLSGSDFTTLMLEVARRRAARETPSTVLRRYRSDRFVRRLAPDGLSSAGPKKFLLPACRARSS